MKKFFVIFCGLIVLFSLSGCHKNDDLVIVLDDSEPLALAPDVEWAVIMDPYAAYKEEALWNASVSKHCRKGEILMIKGKVLDKNKETWYYFQDGWLPESCLSVYSNRLKAKSVSDKLLNSN